MKNSSMSLSIYLLFSFFVSSCIFAYCPFIIKIVLVSVCLLTFLFIIIKRNKSSFLRILSAVLISCTIAGVYSSVSFDMYAKKIDSCHGATDEVILRVSECDYSLSYMARYVAIVEESGLIPRGTKILLSSQQTSLNNGSILSGEIEYASLSETNSSSFDGVRYYLPKRIMITAEDINLRYIEDKSTFSISGIFDKINSRLTAMIMGHFPKDSGGIQAAVLLGNKDYLADNTSRDFRRLGISHLLVISGTHFSVIVMMAENIMRRLRLNRKLRSFLNILLIMFFMLLTGFTPSVTRAGIMYLIAQLSVLVSRKANSLNSVALAGTVMILFNPYLAVDVGMQLSFIASYTCIVFIKYRSFILRKLRRKFKVHSSIYKLFRSLAETTLLTCTINLATLPLMWLYFGEVSLLSIPANIVFIPCIIALIYITSIFLVVYPLRIFIYPLTVIIGGFCSLIEELASFMAKSSIAVVSLNYFFSPLFLVPIAAIIFMFPLITPKHYKKVLISLSSLMLCFILIVSAFNIVDLGNTHISYISEKKNDGVVIKSNGKILLCDISDGSFGFSYNLINEMSNLHVCEIEAVFLTHYHNKHVQLVGRLCEREIVRSLVLTYPTNESEESIYNSLIETASYYGIDTQTIGLDNDYCFGDTVISLLDRAYISRSTHPITAVKFEIDGISTVVASCSFNEADPKIINEIEKADYVILGKHSPVYKKRFVLSFETQPKEIILSDMAYEFMNDETKSYVESVGYISSPDQYRIVIRPDK